MEYQPPPAFGPPESRVGPLRPDEVQALLNPPAYPQPSYPPPPYSPYAAPRRSRASWLVVAAIAATVLMVGGIVALVSSGRPAHRATRSISLPDSVGDYRLIRSIDGHTIEAMLGTQLGPLGAIQGALDSAKVGVYGIGQVAGPTIVFLGFNGADDASIGDLLSSTDSTGVVAEVMSGAGASLPKSLSPGPLGGALQCSQAEQDGTSFTPCAWADADTLALVLQVGLVDVDGAGAVALRFRSAAEH